MHDLAPILAEHDFFKDLDKKYLPLLVGCAKNVRFEPEQIIHREGDPADEFYLIRKGRVRVEIHSTGIGPVVIQTLTDGDIFGSNWLIPPYKWLFDYRAVDRTRALSMDGKCLRGKCDEDHDLGYALMMRFSQVLSKRLYMTRMQLLLELESFEEDE
ncbi:MAG: cyclic nucleotide-binding domain-containing protein [Desulfohalobiaceae bacterium]|nr:cyclic nucleotide-binding domain-containing protein [Desulfohalobiaceae bacterium]